MSHLTLERLAALLDTEPEPAERAHIEECDVCREELHALGTQAHDLRSLEDPVPGRDAWDRLHDRLAVEGLLADAAPGSSRPAMESAFPFGAAAYRWAAAVALLVLGGLAGAFAQSALAGRAADSPHVAGGMPGQGGTFTIEAAAITSPDEAARYVRAAEAAYLVAVARYLELADPSELPDPITRLAALEGIVATTRAALNQAPADPVINGFHMAAAAQREAMLINLAVAERPWF